MRKIQTSPATYVSGRRAGLYFRTIDDMNSWMGSLMHPLVQDLLTRPSNARKVVWVTQMRVRFYRVIGPIKYQIARILHHRRTCAPQHSHHSPASPSQNFCPTPACAGLPRTPTNVEFRALHYHCFRHPPVTPPPPSSPSTTGFASPMPIRLRLSGCATADASSRSSCRTTRP